MRDTSTARRVHTRPQTAPHGPRERAPTVEPTLTDPESKLNEDSKVIRVIQISPTGVKVIYR